MICLENQQMGNQPKYSLSHGGKLPSEATCAPDFPSHPFPPALVTPFPLLSQSLADNTSKIPGRSLISMRTEPNFSLWSCWDAPASPTK